MPADLALRTGISALIIQVRRSGLRLRIVRRRSHRLLSLKRVRRSSGFASTRFLRGNSLVTSVDVPSFGPVTAQQRQLW
jgi:hypothetical protein